MAVSKLIEFLDEHRVKYVIIAHSQAYTAQEIAACAHIKGKELAKTVIVRADGRLAMAVLASSHQVDFNLLAREVEARRVTLATEEDFRGLFLDCHVGAMPPFGNLYGLQVYVDSTLTEDEEITFNACCHTKLIRMSYRDFERLVQPTVATFAVKHSGQPAAV